MQFSLSKIEKNLRYLFLFLFSTSVFAANGHLYLGGTIGASVTDLGNNNPIIHYYGGNLTDAYPVNDNHKASMLIGINGGYEFTALGCWPNIALGLGIYNNPRDYQYKGQVIETASGDRSSTLYNYKYQIASTRLMFEAQFTWVWLEKLLPFLNIGMGAAWTRINGYTESPVNNTGYVPLPPFQSNTNTQFAYQVGIGVGYAFNFKPCVTDYSHERISLGYRYVNLGDVSFGTRGALYPFPLKLGRLTNNEVSLSYTHLF